MSEYLEKKKLRGRDFLESTEDDEMLDEYFLEDSIPDADSSLEVGEDLNSEGNSDLEVGEDLNSEGNSSLELGKDLNSEINSSLEVGEDLNSDVNSSLEVGEDLNSEGNSSLEVGEDSNSEVNSDLEVDEDLKSTPEVFDNENHNLRKGREYLQTDESGEDSSSAPEFTEDLSFGSEAFDNEKPSPKKGREYLDDSEDSYPKITYLSDKKFFDVPNVEPSQGNYIAAGTTVAVSLAGTASLYSSLVIQLGRAINSLPLAKTIVNSNLGKFLLMDEHGMQGAHGGIYGVGDIIAGKIMGFYAPFISKNILNLKSSNLVTDVAKTLHEPNQDNLIRLAVDTVDVAGTYYQYTPAVLAPIVHSAYLAYQGDYVQAANKLVMASSYILPYIMTPANPASLFILGGISAVTAYNLYTSLNDYMNDKDSLKSTKAYEELYQSLSETPIEFLNDFASKKVQEYDIAISKIQKENIERYLVEQGEFGKKLNEHIYRFFQTKEDEVAPKHAIIELEDKSYNHCIEFKAAMDVGNNTHYNCYSDELKLIDRVIIGENEDVINVIVHNIYHG